MANFGMERGIRDDDRGRFDVMVDKVEGGRRVVVDVLEALGNVGGYLHPGEPG